MKNNRRVSKAVITAAGFGTRFLPATKTIPKEMLPILEYPAIHYVVKEIVDAGIEDICIVTRVESPTMQKYFGVVEDVEEYLKESGKEEILKKVQYSNDVANITFLKQDTSLPYGSGAPIVSAKEWIGDENFVVLYCDDLVLSKESAIKSLIELFQSSEDIDAVVAAQEVDWKEVSKYGIVEFKEGSENQLERLTEKPKQEDAKTNLAYYGRHVFTPKLFEFLDPTKVVEGEEFYLTNSIYKMSQNGKVLVKKVDGKWLTTGDPLNMLKTSIEYGLSREEYRDEILKFMLQCCDR
jgi:UTP--glucose-1-phosphate uridylyltransferase